MGRLLLCLVLSAIPVVAHAAPPIEGEPTELMLELRRARVGTAIAIGACILGLLAARSAARKLQSGS